MGETKKISMFRDLGSNKSESISDVPSQSMDKLEQKLSGYRRSVIEEEALTLVNELKEGAVPELQPCADFQDVCTFAKTYIDAIIKLSLEVCLKIKDNEKPYDFDSKTSLQKQAMESLTNVKRGDSKNPLLSNQSLHTTYDTSDIHYSIHMFEEAPFKGWPTNEEFTVQTGLHKIMEFMSQWYCEEDWKYTVNFLGESSNATEDYYIYEAIWCIPTKEYPIAQATASIYFSITTSRIKPSNCTCDVTYEFEGSKFVHSATKLDFTEEWLFNIIDSKINLFKKLTF